MSDHQSTWMCRHGGLYDTLDGGERCIYPDCILAHEVEGSADYVSGKGAPRARIYIREAARKMRDAAMTPDMVRACER